MSVWAHVGAAELLRDWVHWLWFKKTNRTKGPGGWEGRGGEEGRTPYEALLFSGHRCHRTRYLGGTDQAAQPLPAAQRATSV